LTLTANLLLNTA